MGGENVDLRESFIDELIEIAKTKKDMVVLDPDVGSATRTWNFGSSYPDRFYELGIAEQNTFGVAAGLAATGLTVVRGYICCLRFDAGC
jgi:transketolase